MQMKREGVKWNLTLVLCCETFRRQKKGSVVIIPLSIQSKMMPCKSNRVCVYINPKRKRFQFRSLFCIEQRTSKQNDHLHTNKHIVYTRKAKVTFFSFGFCLSSSLDFGGDIRYFIHCITFILLRFCFEWPHTMGTNIRLVYENTVSTERSLWVHCTQFKRL